MVNYPFRFKRPKFSSRFIEDWAILHPSPETRENELDHPLISCRKWYDNIWRIERRPREAGPCCTQHFQNGGFLAIRKPFRSLFASRFSCVMFDFVVCNGIPARIKVSKEDGGIWTSSNTRCKQRHFFWKNPARWRDGTQN